MRKLLQRAKVLFWFGFVIVTHVCELVRHAWSGMGHVVAMFSPTFLYWSHCTENLPTNNLLSQHLAFTWIKLITN